MSNKHRVVINNSILQGMGVFAAKVFHKGDEILEIDDSHVVNDVSTLSKDDWEYNTDYFDGKTILMQEPERYINHSCDPNSFIKTIGITRNVFAIRNIYEGEEITYDYAINGENEGSFHCNCGSTRCREIYIGNYFKLPMEIQIEYLPYLDNWFIRKYSEKIERLKQGNNLHRS
jgi:hypothetical protein